MEVLYKESSCKDLCLLNYTHMYIYIQYLISDIKYSTNLCFCKSPSQKRFGDKLMTDKSKYKTFCFLRFSSCKQVGFLLVNPFVCSSTGRIHVYENADSLRKEERKDPCPRRFLNSKNTVFEHQMIQSGLILSTEVIELKYLSEF